MSVSFVLLHELYTTVTTLFITVGKLTDDRCKFIADNGRKIADMGLLQDDDFFG